MYLRNLVERLRQSLWFIPSIGSVAAGIVALVMVGLSALLEDAGIHLPLVFEAGADGARAMLQAIAGSVITVAGVVFSITIVALQLTSTQFSPRVLRNFLRDRPTQFVLAVFMGTFVYALLVLRTIHTGTNGDSFFVPNVAVTGALVLGFASLAMLIFYIHHISVRIQVGSILAAVTAETFETIDDIGEELREPEREATNGAAAAADGPPREVKEADFTRPLRVRARSSGYVRIVALKGLFETASENDIVVRCLVAPGDWVQAGAPLLDVAEVDELPDGIAERLVSQVTVGSQRTMQQDVAFGVQQLVDIAVKALSPGINDPTTAIQCLDRLTQVLVAVGERRDPPHLLRDEEGVVRVVLRFPGFDELTHEAFRQVRQYAAHTPVVLRYMARSLRTLELALPAARRDAVVAEARLIARAAEQIPLAEDRSEVLAALRGLVPTAE